MVVTPPSDFSLTTRARGSCIGMSINLMLLLILNHDCSHIDWHLEAGLAIAFAEAPADNIAGPHAQISPQEWKGLCPKYWSLPPQEQ